MDESLLVWISAIESGFAQPAEWVGWADRQILRLDNPPVWILDLSLQHSAKEALQILWAASCQVAPELWETIDTTGLYFGFLYLGFERNELSMLDLLT